MKNNIHLQRIMISVLTVALVLGVTVCPVFCTDYSYTLVEKSQFCTDFNAVLSWTNKGTYANTDFFISNYPTRYSSLINAVQSQYSIDTTNLVAYILGETSTSYSVQIIVASKYPYQGSPTSTMTSTSSGTQGFTLYYPSGTIYYYYNGNESKTDGSFYNFSTGGGSTTQISLVLAKNNLVAVVPFYITVSPTTSYLDTYYLGTYQVQPGSGGGGGSSGDVGNIGDVNWVNFASMLAAYLGANYTFTINGTTYNSSYSNVGWCLAYLFECMENPTLQTITLDNTTMDNPVFRLLYGNAQNPTVFDEIKLNSVAINNYLSQIRTLLNEAVYEEDNNIDMITQQLVYLRGDIQDIYDDLYPEDARIINNTMEEEFYDSENGGTSLTEMQTVFGVGTESRDAFDTGASFSLSGLFSFKNDGNWGFWSTQCQNDMDNVPQVRKSENYDSTAYDDQLEELMSIWGVGNNGK